MSIQKIPEPIKRIFRPVYYFLQHKKIFLFNKIWKSKTEDYHRIPIIINNFNRLSYLLQLLDALEVRRYTNIYILDNASSYAPLLEYYSRCPYKVIRLTDNLGYLALWKSGLYNRFKRDYYVYTDSDVVPVEACPEDFLFQFRKKLESNNTIMKVGFSLKIDDIPQHYKFRKEVLENEAQYFNEKCSDNFYKANIDTTFALYRPGYKGGANLFQTMYRSAHPYEARHLPWYTDSSQPGKEELFYLNSIQKSTHWSSISSKSYL